MLLPFGGNNQSCVVLVSKLLLFCDNNNERRGVDGRRVRSLILKMSIGRFFWQMTSSSGNLTERDTHARPGSSPPHIHRLLGFLVLVRS
jgi:hypothetical protein